VLVARPVRAQDDEPVEAPGVLVQVEADEAPPEDRTAAVEVVRVDDRTTGTSLAEVLDEVAGVRIRRLGGLESHATVSIRGSTSGQVLVLRDGVPLGSASGSEVDINEIPLGDVERIEVYRGPSAAHFGAGGLGGVVNLVSRNPEGEAPARVEVGLGSFMPGHFDAARIFSFTAGRRVALRTVARDERGRYSILGGASFWSTDGDFTYLDDNGTLWEESDDFYARRENNDATQGDASLRGVVELGGAWRLVASESFSVRHRGVPGQGIESGSVARLRTLNDLTLIELERTRPGHGWPLLHVQLSARIRRDEWVDRLGQIGVGREHDDDLTLDVGARTRAGWTLPVSAGNAWLQGDVRYERFFARSLLDPGREWSWQRISGALSGWITWSLAGDALELSPQARLDVIRDGPSGDGPPVAGGAEPETTSSVLTSEQLGLRGHVTRWLDLRAAAGLSQRPATFLELLGDRGTVVGNPALRPESGWTVDGGLELEGRDLGALERVRLEATGFYRYVDDLIQLVPNSQVTFVAVNVGAARVAGLEATGQLRIDWAGSTRSPWPGWIDLRLGVTYMSAVDRSDFAHREGRQLPLRPEWEVFGRVAFIWGPITLAYELDYLAGNYLDPYNSFPVPHRLLHGLEVVADLARWRGPELALQVRNLTDRIAEEVPVRGLGERTRPVSDVMGFPLPGLTVFLDLRWDVGEPRSSAHNAADVLGVEHGGRDETDDGRAADLGDGAPGRHGV
jgi:iron complex outermembrane receptor protein